MSDWASENDSAIELVINAYNALKERNPKHELLKYITRVTPVGFEYPMANRTREDFLKKFAPKENTPQAVMLANYFLALKKANESPLEKTVQA